MSACCDFDEQQFNVISALLKLFLFRSPSRSGLTMLTHTELIKPKPKPCQRLLWQCCTSYCCFCCSVCSSAATTLITIKSWQRHRLWWSLSRWVCKLLQLSTASMINSRLYEESFPFPFPPLQLFFPFFMWLNAWPLLHSDHFDVRWLCWGVSKLWTSRFFGDTRH